MTIFETFETMLLRERDIFRTVYSLQFMKRWRKSKISAVMKKKQCFIVLVGAVGKYKKKTRKVSVKYVSNFFLSLRHSKQSACSELKGALLLYLMSFDDLCDIRVSSKHNRDFDLQPQSLVLDISVTSLTHFSFPLLPITSFKTLNILWLLVSMWQYESWNLAICRIVLEFLVLLSLVLNLLGWAFQL